MQTTRDSRVVVHTENGDRRGLMTPEDCLRLESAGRGLIVRSRRGEIKRFILHPVPSGWLGGGCTTERIRNQWGVIVGAPKTGLTHKPLYSSR